MAKKRTSKKAEANVYLAEIVDEELNLTILGTFSSYTLAKKAIGKKEGIVTQLPINNAHPDGIGVCKHFHLNCREDNDDAIENFIKMPFPAQLVDEETSKAIGKSTLYPSFRSILDDVGKAPEEVQNACLELIKEYFERKGIEVPTPILMRLSKTLKDVDNLSSDGVLKEVCIFRIKEWLEKHAYKALKISGLPTEPKSDIIADCVCEEHPTVQFLDDLGQAPQKVIDAAMTVLRGLCDKHGIPIVGYTPESYKNKDVSEMRDKDWEIRYYKTKMFLEKDLCDNVLRIVFSMLEIKEVSELLSLFPQIRNRRPFVEWAKSHAKEILG